MTENIRFRFLLLAATTAFVWGATLTMAPAGSAKAKKKRVVFNRDIRPILSKCLTCHGNDKKAVAAGLRLDSFAGATKKLASGERAIVPGHPEKSELVNRIRADKDSGEMMPPAASNKVLDAEEKALLVRWIEEGAEYKAHWAFETPVRPALPEVRNSKWVKNDIDRFILAKLEESGLKPSAEADKPTLIRRVTLDLIGLPPTPAEVKAFLADKSPNAYERVVDRLLASPRYAERMAMDWMDYARYADSNGYQADFERFQWRWRDWVLNAFDKNMPYDQFTVEQLAGDMLPNATTEQKIATGFNRNHRINTEGGVVAEEWRIETVIDRVETTSTVWLGLTAGCARCHDHKYDPISQKEFYGMFSYFNNVPESGSGEERPVNHPPFIKAPRNGDLAKLQQKRAAAASVDQRIRSIALKLQSEADKWVLPKSGDMASLHTEVAGRYSFNGEAKVVEGNGPEPKLSGPVKFEAGHQGVTAAVSTNNESYVDLGPVGDFDSNQAFSYAAWINPRSPNSAVFSKMDTSSDFRGWDLFLDGGSVMVHLISKWPEDAVKIYSRKKIEPMKWSHIAMTYDGSKKASGLRLYINGELAQTDVEKDSLTGSIRTPVSLKLGRRTGANVFDGLIEGFSLYGRSLSRDEIVNLSGAHPAQPILSIPAEKRTAAQREQLARIYAREKDPEFAKLDDQLVAMNQAASEVENSIPTVMVMEEMPKPRQARILIRGQYDKLGAAVPPTIPAALPKIPKGLANNRLGFAKWIVDPSNPLTARVTVNRFWERFFGTGIVASIEDFGTRADFPSHPELLDYLATDFVASKWNVKGFLKKLVMSATYRQSAIVSKEMLRIDPANRLLGRGPRIRLPAEVLRDQALMAAGLLVNKMGGPSVRPYQPEGIWDETNVYGNLRNYKPDMGEGRYRRSLYTIWKRTAAPPDMTLFDVSSREICRVRRPRTNTPLQALTMMNDVTYVEAARGLAQRTLREAPASPEARIKFMMMAVLGRFPTVKELTILSLGLKKRIARFEGDVKAAEKLIAVGDLPSPANQPKPQIAAYTLLANTILNLDEAVTKE